MKMKISENEKFWLTKLHADFDICRSPHQKNLAHLNTKHKVSSYHLK